MSSDEIRKLARTLKVWREKCGVHPVHIWDAHVEMEAALLAYAAMVERCEREIARLPYPPNGDDVHMFKTLNRILRGDARKGER